MSHISEFIKWVVTDSLKEEIDILSESGIEEKKFSKAALAKARKFFLAKLEEE